MSDKQKTPTKEQSEKTPLFREEAIRHRTRALFGDVVLAAPLSTWLITGLLVAILAGVFAFGVFGSISKQIDVHTKLLPNKYDVTIIIEQKASQIITIGDWVSLKPTVNNAKFRNLGGPVHSIKIRDGELIIIAHINSMNHVTTPAGNWTETEIPLRGKLKTSERMPIWRWVLGGGQ